jgi:adenylylsulfate kinase-like enzyme
MPEEHHSRPGHVVWITGFAGAGKTTLARAAQARWPRPVVLLDGDALREALGGDHGHGREARLQLAQSYARLARLVAASGVDVLVATISMFHEVHAWNREHIPLYAEVYLEADRALLHERDQHGLYRATSSEQVVGEDLAAETPLQPDIVFTVGEIALDEMVSAIIKYLGLSERQPT